MASSPDLESEFDELYAGDPDDFVASRNALAKRLTKDGRKESAAEVKALRKPTRAAALVNQLSRERPKQIATLIKAGEKLRDVATVSDQKKLRAAVAAERKALQTLLDAAEKAAAESDASAATLKRVGETLRAIVSDPELAELVVSGRLDAEREASTIGFELALTPSAGKKPKSTDARKERQAAQKLEKAKLDRLTGELEKARKREAEAHDRVEVAEAQFKRARESSRMKWCNSSSALHPACS